MSAGNAAIDQRITEIEAHVGHSVNEGAPEGWAPTEVKVSAHLVVRKVWAGLLTAVDGDVYWAPDAMAPPYWFPPIPG